ncbi:hypothetical protein HWV62_41416 [Athelia sp. TMB]|nr:hypothetical protein HWV62_34028 [Athelia sp. TMB]KAF7986047.1 hypothetical protein HWV62_41416 [Athelia sp. TMB]
MHFKLPDLYEASITELQRGLRLGFFTSVHLVKVAHRDSRQEAYLARIEEVNYKGPKLCAVIETNPQALEQAAEADDERKRSLKNLGILHGIPILVKDNIATKHEEGSHALVSSVVPRDATVVRRLREAGAIIIGKTNLSEWASYRGVVPSGWSGREGQGTSPYYPLLDPSGSSSGSAVAAAIGLAAGALGTETTGSITLPASNNNVVGIKPTVGLTSRAGVIPISSHQDSVGPMARTVEDIAIILSAIVGPDALDPATLAQPTPTLNYREALNFYALRGARLGVPRKFQSRDEAVNAAFNQAIEIMRARGAVIVDPAEFPDADEIQNSTSESVVLAVDFKVHKWCLILFIASEATTVDEEYYAALATKEDLGRTRGIDATLKKYDLDAILLPAPVPLGFQPQDLVPTAPSPTIKKAPGAPFGISFSGSAFSEFKLISLAFAYEQATLARLGRRAYEEAIPVTQLKDVMENN